MFLEILEFFADLLDPEEDQFLPSRRYAETYSEQIAAGIVATIGVIFAFLFECPFPHQSRFPEAPIV